MIADKKILIRTPFSEQYTITIDSDIKGVDVYVTSKVQLRYDFHVLRIDDVEVEVRLVQLDNVLLDANNPMIVEVAQVSQIFGRMYNELHLILDKSGNVKEVLNTDFILSKWKQTKAEMEKHIMANEDLQNAIILNDAIFNDPEKIKIGVQANEFIKIYFGQVFNLELPSKGYVKGTNIFNTAEIDWKMETESSPVLPPSSQIKTVAITCRCEPKNTLKREFYQAAYSQFENKIDIKLLNSQLFQQETRMIDYLTGRVLEAEVNKQEIADEQRLYNKLSYTLKSDSGSKPRAIEENQHTEIPKEEAEQNSSRFKFF